MLSILSPPTDNLYKFMAIFGLIIYMLCIYFPLSEVYKLSLEVIDAEKQVSLYVKKQEFLKQDRLVINERIGKLDKVISIIKKPISNEDSLDLTKLLSNLKDDKNLRDYFKFKYEYFDKYFLPFKLKDEVVRLNELYLEKNREFELLSVEIDSNITVISNRIEIIRKYYIWGTILMIISIVLISFGFSLWYFKIQRHIDNKIANQSLENKQRSNDNDPHS